MTTNSCIACSIGGLSAVRTDKSANEPSCDLLSGYEAIERIESRLTQDHAEHHRGTSFFRIYCYCIAPIYRPRPLGSDHIPVSTRACRTDKLA